MAKMTIRTADAKEAVTAATYCRNICIENINAAYIKTLYHESLTIFKPKRSKLLSQDWFPY
jgi:hypothetical protein